MGNKQSTSSKSTAMPHLLSQADLKRIEYENELYYQQRARRTSRQPQQMGNQLNGSQSMKRTVSTPFMADVGFNPNPSSNRPSNNNRSRDQEARPKEQREEPSIQQLAHPPQYLMAAKLKKNPSTIIELNNQLKSKQADLTTAIKKLDSAATNQPSQHLSSKLYKPNASMLHATLQTNHNNHVKSRAVEQQHHQQPPPQPAVAAREQANTLPIKNSDSSSNMLNSKMSKNSRNSRNSDMSGSSDGFTNKLGKKFGLSPKFKRKIVETIANRVNGNTNNQKNSLFAQSRLLQALQSQWNLFTSIDENGYNSLPRKRRQSNNTTNQNNTGTSSTFLSISLERNSFRYASRRKYKTQSLANPYRHADTNYPVYTHEALFMPEFSVKGQVTEADFEIIDVISRGAFGHVIKVRMKKTPEEGDQQIQNADNADQIYAMKIMWKSQVIRDRALQQVKDEVTIAVACVDNPLIVKTWYYWQSKRFLYIITDFIENGELLSLWLRVHHFPERVVACYAVEMALALDYLHRRGIIYRDIKMENILLDKRGHVQLIDFGLSKWLAMGDRTCTICGTIQYMAPEILSVEPYDHSVDWWSLGILIYALLSGEYPLNAAKDHIQMNERVSRHVFELERAGSGNHSAEACDLVRRLLRKNPHRRLRSLTECKKEGFFLKEMQLFINRDLVEKKKTTSSQEKENLTLLVKENYWNPYFILENYSPLELLFEELSSGYSSSNLAANSTSSMAQHKSDRNPVKTVHHNNTTTTTATAGVKVPIETSNHNFTKSKHHTESSTTTNTTNSSSEISTQREMTDRPLSSRQNKESTTTTATTTTTSSSEDEQSSSGHTGQNNSRDEAEDNEDESERSEYEIENSLDDDDIEVVEYNETDKQPQSTRNSTTNEYHHHHFHHHYNHHHHHYDHNQSQV